MRNKLAAVAVCAAGLVASACSDQSTTQPTAPQARLPKVASPAVFALLACDNNALKADARDFAKSTNDPLLKIITDLGKLTPYSAAATDKVFDGLARMAAIRGTSDQRSGVARATFDHLVHRFLGCADPAVTSDVADVDFGPALGMGWMFEVRGKTANPYADPPGGAYERGSNTANWWAVEAPGGWASAITSSVTDHRALIFGYETNYLNINGQFGGSSFENKTIPGIAANKFAISVNVGLCVADASTIPSTARLNHNYKFLSLINNMTCSTPTPFTVVSLASAASSAAKLAKQAVGFFMPQTAFAAFAAGSVGGAPSELSPSAVYDLSKVFLAYNGTIADNFVNVALKTTTGQPVMIRATNAANGGGDPIPGLTIQLAIAGNSSTIAFFNDNGTSKMTVIRTTGPDGWATFDGVSLTKAGGYTLAAQVYFDGVAGPLFLSNSFNIQNK